MKFPVFSLYTGNWVETSSLETTPSSGESGANLWIDRETGLPLHERAGVLRHFADIRIIPVLLGHGRLATTAIYTRVATTVTENWMASGVTV